MVVAVAAGPYTAVPGAKKTVEVGHAVAADLLAVPEPVLVNLEAKFEGMPPTDHRNVIGDLVSVLHSIQDRGCEAAEIEAIG